MRRALGGRVLAVIVGAADDDLDVVDRRARAVGQPEVQPAELHVEFDDHHRTGEPGPGQVQLHRTHPPVQGQPRRHDPLPLALERAEHPAQFHPIGGRGDDRARSGQVEDQGVEVGVQPRLRHHRRAFLELVDVDQPERDGVVQPPQRAVAVGVGDPHRGFVVDTCHAGINGTVRQPGLKTLTVAPAEYAVSWTSTAPVSVPAGTSNAHWKPTRLPGSMLIRSSPSPTVTPFS